MLAGTQTQIDDVVGRANRLLVVLDDNHRVAEIAEPCEGREQGAIVALVQANRRLIEHVQHAGEVRADLRGEADTLPFAARQRRGASAKCQIPDADVVQEMQPIANLTQNARGDQSLAFGQLLFVKHADRFGHRQVDVLGDRPAFHAYGAALRLQPFTAARRAWTERAIRLEILLLQPRTFLIPAAEIRNQSFESGPEWI